MVPDRDGLPLEALSRLGFGCYRVRNESKLHEAALRSAIEAGCNLIDVAPTYGRGSAERLVGRVMGDVPRHLVFIIDKAGYVTDDPVKLASEVAADPFQRAGNGLHHSLDADVLLDQIDRSLAALGTSYIDCLLLHNPEDALWTTNLSADLEYRQVLARAFAVLEDVVASGRIRYYGVSSNALPSAEPDGPLGVRTLVDIAASVTTDPHLAVLEFPLNLVERKAIEPHADGGTVLQMAPRFGLRTIANRPLNAITSEGVVRLADAQEGMNQPPDADAFVRCARAIERQIRRQRMEGDPDDIPIVALLRDGWTAFEHPDAVEEVFRGYFYPTIRRIYDGAIPASDVAAYRALHTATLVHANRALASRARALRQELEANGVIDRLDPRPLPLVAATTYLRWGVDHVLMGMRRSDYVQAMRSLFTPAESAIRS